MALKRGFIILWYGEIADIPYGWQLCDGSNGTPDLRNRFVVGAGDTYDPGDNNAGPTHTHDFTSDTHTHSHPTGSDIQSGTTWSNVTNPTAVTGTTDPSSSLPPYYALAYIMKMASN